MQRFSSSLLPILQLAKKKVVLYSIRMTKDICVNEVTVHVQKKRGASQCLPLETERLTNT